MLFANHRFGNRIEGQVRMREMRPYIFKNGFHIFLRKVHKQSFANEEYIFLFRNIIHPAKIKNTFSNKVCLIFTEKLPSRCNRFRKVQLVPFYIRKTFGPGIQSSSRFTM